MMPVLLGFQAALYYGVVGTARVSWGALSPTTGMATGALPGGLALMNSVKTVKVNAPYGEADVTTRASGGVKLAAQALLELSLEVEMPAQPADAGYQALRQAALTRQTIPIACLDQVGGDGWWIDAVVLQLSRDEPDDKEETLTFSLKPGLSAVAPQWVSISGS